MQYACPSVYVHDTVRNKAKIIIFLLSDGRVCFLGQNHEGTRVSYNNNNIYIIMPSTRIILLHAAAAGILSARFWSDFAICLRRKAFTTKANANIANVYSNYTKKPIKMKRKSPIPEIPMTDARSRNLGGVRKKIILVIT